MNSKTSGAMQGASAGSAAGPYGAIAGGILGYLSGGSADNEALVQNMVNTYGASGSGSAGQVAKTWDSLSKEELERAKKLDDFSDWGG